ncbi:hypothetical protein [Leptospira kanakyensis]|uniref:hypothetical protein n=1 Tax=Leptospira kanakyensis TaxID=2484968 RepID=UPI00223CC781|nr:hypothetical protein [Leptospira kanakyensis]MCW7469597.1 hypothetical protein [Leptospira kanakyensis]
MLNNSIPQSKTFIDLCLAGERFIDEIDDFIDEWHDSESEQSLSEFLGMTKDEYALWVEKPGILSYIIHARKHRVSLFDELKDIVSKSNLSMAARTSEGSKDAEILIQWLQSTGRLT